LRFMELGSSLYANATFSSTNSSSLKRRFRFENLASNNKNYPDC
jgi:hypothetical protein